MTPREWRTLARYRARHRGRGAKFRIDPAGRYARAERAAVLLWLGSAGVMLTLCWVFADWIDQ